MTPKLFELKVPGATARQIEAGERAAWEVFSNADTSPARAARGAFEREGWDARGFPDDGTYTAAESRAAQVWDEALAAAVEACCEGWPKGASTFEFSLTDLGRRGA